MFMSVVCQCFARLASELFFDGAIKKYDVSETRITFYVSRNGVFLLPVTSGLFVCWRHKYTEAPPAPRSNGLACVNDTPNTSVGAFN